MKLQGSLAGLEVNPRTVEDRRASGAIRGSAGTARRGRCWWPAGVAACSGASSEVLPRVRGVRAATQGREGSNSGALTSASGSGHTAVAGSGSPRAGLLAQFSAWDRGELGVLDPHSLVPGLLQRVDFSDFESSATGGS